AGREQTRRLTLPLNLSQRLLWNLGLLIESESDGSLIPMRGSQMWPEPRASKVSRDLAPKPAAAPFERRSASDQSAVERWLGTRADTSTRHRSRRRLAPALDMRLASCSF